MIIWCTTCNCVVEARKTDGSEIYPHRKDLKELIFYKCTCNSTIGCHKDTDKPMGTLANDKLKKARIVAHKEFDDLFKNGYMSRKKAYEWLSDKLNISKDNCHIGMFNIEECNLVVSAVYDYFENL